jgi:hypothetical protein
MYRRKFKREEERKEEGSIQNTQKLTYMHGHVFIGPPPNWEHE